MAIKGIDVSNHQGAIDWQKVKKAGIRFAIIRAGYGRTNIDESFKRNIEGAHKVGIPVGVYWFSYALSEDDALAEAKQCVDTIQNYEVSLPVFYDFEAATIDYARQQGVIITKSDYNLWSRKFCEHIESGGYKAGVYYNLDFKRNWVDAKVLGQYYQWLAYYTTQQETGYDLQQYSSNGEVAGISGKVDLDWLYNDALINMIEDREKENIKSSERRIRYIKKLQKSLNDAYHLYLAADGSAGPLTVRAIEQHYLYYKMPTIKNVHVGWVQEVLQMLGYTIEIDNSYGPATRGIVKNFQEDNHLEVDGFAGVQTHLKLISKI